MLKSILALCLIPMLYMGCQDTTSKDTEDSGVQSTTLAAEETIKEMEPYFKGVGTEPFWDVQISDEIIRFYTLNNADEKLVVPNISPVKVADANIKTYLSTLDDGTFKVSIAQGECSDNMSENTYNYKVVVEIKKDNESQPVTYEGCGNYVTDYRLNDIWVLEELEGEKVTAESFSKELPNMEIDTKENRFSGHAGCNRMTGALFFEKNVLRFTDVVTTKMLCPPTNKEEDFLKALQASTTYTIENNRLHLSNPDGKKLIFKKVD